MIDAAIYQELSSAPGVVAISPRVYFMAAPDAADAYPCTEFKYVGGSSAPTLTSNGVIQQRVEVNALGFGAEAVADLSVAQVAALLCLNHAHSRPLANGARIVSVQLLNPGTDFVTEQRLFRRMVEFYVLYTMPN